MSNLQPRGLMHPRIVTSTAQHKIINLLKTSWHFFFMTLFKITCHNIFNVWPKTTLLLPVWPRTTKRLDTHVRGSIPLSNRIILMNSFPYLKWPYKICLQPRAKYILITSKIICKFLCWGFYLLLEVYSSMN